MRRRQVKRKSRIDGKQRMRRFTAKSRKNSLARSLREGVPPRDVKPWRDSTRHPTGRFASLSGRINQRAAAPAGEPFPPWFDEIRSAVIPANVSHPLRPRCGLSFGGRILLNPRASWSFRFPARIFARHILPPRLVSVPPGATRPGQEAQGVEPCSSANLIA
jgi:hypothetical protein